MIRTRRLAILAATVLVLGGCSGFAVATPAGLATATQAISASSIPTSPPTPTPNPTSGTATPLATATPGMALSPANQALIDAWMKGTGIPDGGFIGTNGKPLGYGYISVDSGGVNSFQGEIVTGQQIGSDYYVFEGFVKGSVRYFVAFDAAGMDREDYYIFEHSRGGRSVGGLDNYFALKTRMLAGIMPQLAGTPSLINLRLTALVDPPSGNADLFTWTNAHLEATKAFATYVKSGGSRPSLVNRIPNPKDQPNAQPSFADFTLQVPVEYQSQPQST